MVKVGIIGAMKEEISEYLSYAKNIKKKQWKEFVFTEASMFNQEVIIVKSGVGKVFSAMICQKLIDDYHPDFIIFTGVAGAINKNLKIGDVVISKDCIQFDMDGRGLGFPIGQIPYTNYSVFTADKKLKEIALKVYLKNNKITEGRILTGDRFITDSNTRDCLFLTNELKGDANDMESAAVAQVCTINQIPFLIIRTISDSSDKNAAENFKKFLKTAAKNSCEVLTGILKKL
jgi:adenosylhomocysteine nucleosidase